MNQPIVVQTPRGNIALPGDFEQVDDGLDPVRFYHPGRISSTGIAGPSMADLFLFYENHWGEASVTFVGDNGHELPGFHLRIFREEENPLYQAISRAYMGVHSKKAAVAFVFGIRRDHERPQTIPQGVLLPIGDGEWDLLAVVARIPIE